MKKFLSFVFMTVLLFCMPVMCKAESLGVNCPACGADNWTYAEEAATCNSDGYRCWVCRAPDGSGCGYEASKETIPALGHDFSGSNPRICSREGCGTVNPEALTGFSFSLDTHLYCYTAPTCTTLTPNVSPVSVTGHINYSVTPGGIIGLGANSSNEYTAELTTPLEIKALSAGSAVLTIQVYDGCGYYRTESVNITVETQNLPAPVSVEVYPRSVTLESGQTLTIAASVSPSTANQEVLWYSDTPSVCTVSSDGVITATGSGTATVSVSSNADKSVYASIPVSVSEVQVQNLVLSSESLVLTAGKSSKLSCQVLPENADNKTLYWDTSDSSVVYINDGNIYALKAGVAVVTAYSAGGNVSSSCIVTVTDSSTPSWTPVSICTMSYSPGGYSTGTVYETYDYSGAISHYEGSMFSRTGYTQTGWSLDYYGRTLDYRFYEAYTVGGDMTLYPYWTVNPSTPLKLTINYNSSLGTVYFNGKVFPSGHYWSINEGETLSFSFVPVSGYYASYVKLAGRYPSVYNNTFSVSYDDMKASDQAAYVNFASIYSKPKTGDNADLNLWTFTGAASAAGMVLILRKKKSS